MIVTLSRFNFIFAVAAACIFASKRRMFSHKTNVKTNDVAELKPTSKREFKTLFGNIQSKETLFLNKHIFALKCLFYQNNYQVYHNSRCEMKEFVI